MHADLLTPLSAFSCPAALLVQLGVAAYLYAGLGQTTYAAVLLGLILPQVRQMLRWSEHKVDHMASNAHAEHRLITGHHLHMHVSRRKVLQGGHVACTGHCKRAIGHPAHWCLAAEAWCWLTDVYLWCVCVLQMFFQYKYLIPDPIANDVKYQASAQPFLVFGLLTTALAIGHVNQMV